MFVRPSVRSSVTSFSRDWLISFFSDFWHNDANWQCLKSYRARFSKNLFWANLSWFLAERLQVTLKYGLTFFHGKFFFVVKYRFLFFREIPFYCFPIICFSREWLISFFWFLAQRCKMAMPKMWRSPISHKVHSIFIIR